MPFSLRFFLWGDVFFSKEESLSKIQITFIYSFIYVTNKKKQ